ncbi:hypothetical protein [Thalassoroseus pseudoceratinae]|uniref:hypothetical protein n=1 Tax=Thalassoroseus pseudoceratinae TaxID=2713176 RepID=UPI001421CD5B|nr:hypothetical protein [Thalassoroseus pseudoceratinae]
MSEDNSTTTAWTMAAEVVLLLFTSFMAMVSAINAQPDGLGFGPLQFGLYLLVVPSGALGIVWCILGMVLQHRQLPVLVRYFVFIPFFALALYLGNWVAAAINF